jgi:hypothetical protein
MKSPLLSVITLMMFSSYVNAEVAVINELQEKTQIIGGLLRDAEGNVLFADNQSEAENMCCIQNSLNDLACARKSSKEKFNLPKHLPTVRDLVIAAMNKKNNRKFPTSPGVVLIERADIRAGKIPWGYEADDLYAIDAKNPDQSQDFFYSSRKYYKRPPGDLGKYWVWTSSIGYDKQFGYGTNIDAFVFGLGAGGVYFDEYEYGFNGGIAVRCVVPVSR